MESWNGYTTLFCIDSDLGLARNHHSKALATNTGTGTSQWRPCLRSHTRGTVSRLKAVSVCSTYAFRIFAQLVLVVSLVEPYTHRQCSAVLIIHSHHLC
jgi:hypothetical protein